MKVKPYFQNVEGVTVAVIFPHEWLAEITSKFPRQAEALLGSPGERSQFWTAAQNAIEDWFDKHPLKQYTLQFPRACMPIRVWGATMRPQVRADTPTVLFERHAGVPLPRNHLL